MDFSFSQYEWQSSLLTTLGQALFCLLYPEVSKCLSWAQNCSISHSLTHKSSVALLCEKSHTHTYTRHSTIFLVMAATSPSHPLLDFPIAGYGTTPFPCSQASSLSMDAPKYKVVSPPVLLSMLILLCSDGCQLFYSNVPMVLLPTPVTDNLVANMTLWQPDGEKKTLAFLPRHCFP